jgi:uncharacterized protein with LGFP repeats
VRRITAGFIAFLVMTGTLLVMSVYTAPTPEATPVQTSSEQVSLGSFAAPAPAVVVSEGTTEPVTGVPERAPALTLIKTDTKPFSMVGVTWAYDPKVTDTVVQIRVQDETGAWGEWTEETLEDAGPDLGTDSGRRVRGGTAAVWTGPSTGVEVELVTRSGAQPTDVRVDLIDPGASDADVFLDSPRITDTANAAVTIPPVYARAQWGADESIRTWDPHYASVLKAVTIHHTASSNDYSADQVPAIIRSIYRYHAVSLGWGDIGYNVIADKFGRLWEGRYGGLASTVIGAHAGGFNTATSGISMLGNYETANTTQPMVDAVSAFLTWKLSLHGINPRGTATLTSSGGGTSKYPAGATVTLPTIFGHRDVGKTSCPGQYGYARLGEIRDQVSATALEVWRIRDRYDSDSALRTLLGSVVSQPRMTSDGNGGYARYQNGSLYYTPTAGVTLVPDGPVRDKWGALDWERSWLGYPVRDVSRTPDGAGWYGHFQGGSIYWSSATGARTISGAIRDRWAALGWQTSALGYPAADQGVTPDGQAEYAHFQNGSVYWSAGTGAQVVHGSVRATWASLGWERSSLGLPVRDVGTTPDGQAQFGHFQGGSIYSLSGGVNRVLPKPIVAAWGRNGWERGALGYPTSDVLTASGGNGEAMTFEGGVVYADGDAAAALHGAVLAAHDTAGGVTGVLGRPTTDVRKTPDGVGEYAHFEAGSIYSTADTGAQVVLGPVRDRWARMGWERGLGYPTTSVAATPGGDGQFAEFQRGSIYSTPASGALALQGPVDEAFRAAGAAAGVLGLPSTDVRTTPDGLGEYAHFAGGSIYWTKATGARVVRGPIRDLWAATGWERGLGYPTSSVAATPDGRGQYAHFQGGSIYWTPETGARAVSGPVRSHWAATGWERGLGYPTSSVAATPDGRGRYAHFEGGSIYWTPETGARTVSGPVRSHWAATGWERGLGYPTTSVSVTPDGVGRYAHFERGSIYWTQATGAHALSVPFRDAWASTGWERGSLGYPTRDAYPVTGGTRMDFQHGTITISSSTGKATVTQS